MGLGGRWGVLAALAFCLLVCGCTGDVDAVTGAGGGAVAEAGSGDVSSPSGDAEGATEESLELPQEGHLRNVRQLTSGGENAEAYFSFAGDRLAFQSTRPPYGCDQIFTMALDGSDVQLVSSGKGRTTCAYYLPDGKRVVYASTHLGSEACPPVPDRSQGYVWPIYESFDLFIADGEGNHIRLTDTPGYDAEATLSPKGDRMVFTSVRDGDLDIYSMKLDGSDVQRLTDEVGYDGGAFYSADGSKIVYRAMKPATPEEEADYKRLLTQGLVRPTRLEVWVMDADGSNKRQVTNLGAAAFCPFFHPDGERIIFSSNHADPKRRNFDMFIINVDGTGLERVTWFESFDGFPMFSADGKQLVFCSNRNNTAPSETNIFICDWVD
jgi:Tol biopolymer transport system component